MKYTINLVANLRAQEKKQLQISRNVRMFVMLSFSLLVLSLFYAANNAFRMKLTINAEKEKLARIETEYRKYKVTRLTVDRADIELLDKLQNGRIFWTKKLAAMAFHLPNKPPNPYWINEFGYKNNILNVKGYGYISPLQEQLITIDDYLNELRADTTFSDVFGSSYFNSTKRDDEGIRKRVTFDYSSENTGKKKNENR